MFHLSEVAAVDVIKFVECHFVVSLFIFHDLQI
jgi:hypothetical protein